MKPHTGGPSSTICNSMYAMSEKLNELINDTFKTGVEHGISWCANKSGYPSVEITSHTKPYETDSIGSVSDISKTCIGDKEGVCITQPTYCDPFAGIAVFHTHPGNDGNNKEFSNGDYRNIFLRDRSLNCLGSSDGEKNTITCDAIVKNDSYDMFKKIIIDTFDKHCDEQATAYINAIESDVPDYIISARYADYLNGRERMLDAISDAIKDGVINRCSIASDIGSRTEHAIPDILNRLIKIERRYDSYDSSCIDYIDKYTNKKIGFISYSVDDEWKEDDDGKDYIEKEGKIHEVEFDMEYPAEDILYSSIGKVLCDLKCKGVEKRVYIHDPQYSEIFEDVLDFERSSEDSNTIETDISDLDCECVASVESMTGIV